MEACSVVLAEVNEYLISFAFISIFKKKKSKDSCRNICRVEICLRIYAKFKYSKVCKIVLKKRISKI